MCAGPYKMLKKLHKTLTAKANQDSVLIANAMFTKEGFPMEEAFVATNKANFQCESRSLDFRRPSEAADDINEWVNNKTKGWSPYLSVYLFRRICISPSSLDTRRFSPDLVSLLICADEAAVPAQMWLRCIFIQVTSPAWSKRTCWTRR